MEWKEIIGYLAGVFTTIAAIPQIYKVWKTKQVEDISAKMFFTLFTGVALWTVYGIAKMDWPIIVFNGICAILHGTMLLMIFKFRKK